MYRPLLIVPAVALVAVPLAAVTPDGLSRRLADEDSRPQLVDVRSNHEFAAGHIPGSMNIPFEVLGHRALPPFADVVVVSDGLGRVDAQAAAATLRSRLPDASVDVLEGGFAAWEDGRRLTTRKPGFSAESHPGVRYDALLAHHEADLVLVDLRAPAAKTTVTAAADRSDPIRQLSERLSGARVAGDPFLARPATSTAAASSSLAPAPMSSPSGVPPLLVLIDDNDGRAQEVARKLIAAGNRRFVILTGGTETIRLEGRSLVERTGGAIGQ